MEQHLGNVLRAARKSAGISVDDAVYLAKMPRAVVEALEAEDFGFFSSPLYARSFLKQYGDYVGADVEPWLDDFEPTTMLDGEALGSYINVSEPVAAAVTREKTKNNSGSGSWGTLWMILITAGIVWGSFAGYKKFEQKLAEKPETEESDGIAPDEPVPDELSDPAVEGETSDDAEGKPIVEALPEAPRRAIIVRDE